MRLGTVIVPLNVDLTPTGELAFSVTIDGTELPAQIGKPDATTSTPAPAPSGLPVAPRIPGS